jgi:signal transduction histidine kinase
MNNSKGNDYRRTTASNGGPLRRIKYRVQVQEEVLKRISAELHDHFGQTLIVSLRDIEMLRMDMGSRPGQSSTLPNERIQRVESNLRQILQKLRCWTRASNQPFADEDFFTSLRSHTRLIASVSKMQVVLELDESIAPNRLQSFHLLRIVQEATSNCIRHAAASSLVVKWYVENGTGILTIEDNGRGFHWHERNRAGLGLSNMKDRAVILKGVFALRSSPNAGTSIDVSVPIYNEEGCQ